MAFEVFDDVAFFYLAMSVVAVAVLPWSTFKFASWFWEKFIQKPQLIPLTRIQKLKLAQQKNGVGVNPNGTESLTVQPAAGSPTAAAKSTAAASGLTQENLRPPKPWLTCGNIFLGCLWILFLFMLVQIPTVQDQSLASFKPYEILGIDSKATDGEIKAAYRKQSLVYHPDRNKTPEAAQQFILVAKAYETLTSETAKKNIEKYGNPDGYQGVSVTIGLPSMLTKKENEMRVLVVYFFIFIVLPPIIVWVWWRRAKDFVDGGLRKRSLELWYQFMLPNMGSKFLIEFLSIADENVVLLGPQFPPDIPAFKQLATEVKSHQVKQRFQDPKFRGYFQYSSKASVILHAYLLRLTIPKSMQPDLMFLLKDAHRLLGVLVELAMAKGYVKTVFGLFDLMQLITQGCFPHDSPLMQLPHITQEDVRKLQRKNVKSVHQLLKAPADRLTKILPDYTAEQWAEVKLTGELIPDVQMKHGYGVEDEEGLYEGDLVTLKVNLQRMSFDPDRPEQVEAYRMSDFDGDESEVLTGGVTSDVKKPEPQKKALEEKKEDGAMVAASATAAGESVEMTEVKGGEVSPSPPPMTDDEILDSMPMPKAGKSIADVRASGPSVHSLTFPYPRHERWWVLLVEKSKKSDRIIGIQKVDSFFDEAEVEVKFYAPRSKSAKEDGLSVGHEDTGKWEYEIHAICDSYIGVDKLATFTMKVEKPRGSTEEVAERVKEKVKEEYAELKEEEELEEEYGPWYYLWFPSFWELVLNIAVLGLLCVFIFNFLHSRGYWQKYIQPGTDFVGYYTRPIWDLLYPVIAPVVEPLRSNFDGVWNWCSDMLHRDPFPKHPDDIQIDESTIPGMGQED